MATVGGTPESERDVTQDPGSAYRTRPPFTVGQFLLKLIEGHVALEELARQTELPEETLYAIAGDRLRIDRQMAARFNAVFPEAERVLIGVQRRRDFYDLYGVWRPQSAVRRWAIFAHHLFRR